MHITRRNILSAAAPCGIALTLAACNLKTDQPLTLTDTQAAQLQSLIAGAQGIEASLASAVPGLIAIMHLTGPTATALLNANNAVAAAVQALGTVPTVAAGATYVQAIESGLNVIVGIAATIPAIPEPYHSGLIVAALALPPLEALAGQAIQQGTALAATIAAKKVSSPATIGGVLLPAASGVATAGPGVGG